jgi:hypothetical protein
MMPLHRASLLLAIVGGLAAPGMAAPVDGWMAVDSNGTSPRTVEGDDTSSPVIGNGSNGSANAIALYAPISGGLDAMPDVTLADGFQIKLTGSVLVEGVTSSMEQFRFGLFEEVGPTVDAFGWRGYIANNSSGTGGGALRAKDANFAAFGSTLFISTSTSGSAVNLQTQQDGGSFTSGTYDFAMTIQRHGAALTIDASLRRGNEFAQVWEGAAVSSSNLLTYNFNRVGFLSGASMSADRLSFSDIDVTTGPIPVAPVLILRVTTSGPNAGAARIVNPLGESVSINYYQIASNQSSLDPSGWSSFDDHEGGDAETVGWDEALENDARSLTEVSFLAAKTFAPAESISVGRAYNTGLPTDLQFSYGVVGEDALVNGVVDYVPGGPEGDFDGDAKVDELDLGQWRYNFGIDGGSDADGDRDSDGADFLAWQRGQGTLAAASPAGVTAPEPSSAALLGVAACGLRRRSLFRGARRA